MFPFIQYAPDLVINKFGFSRTLPDLTGASFGDIAAAWVTNSPKVASLIPAAMWPSVAKIVPEKRLGTAYATMFTVQNRGLAAFFFGIGWLLDIVNADNLAAIKAGDMVYDYTIPILTLVGLGCVSIFLAFMLKIADKRQGYRLELPSGHTPDQGNDDGDSPADGALTPNPAQV